jgi:hypothetical protein
MSRAGLWATDSAQPCCATGQRPQVGVASVSMRSTLDTKRILPAQGKSLSTDAPIQQYRPSIILLECATSRNGRPP